MPKSLYRLLVDIRDAVAASDKRDVLLDIRDTLHAILDVLKPPASLAVSGTIEIAGPGLLPQQGDSTMSNTTIDGGPFNLSVDKFVDDGGNTTTDTDIPVWAIDDATLGTLVPNAAPDQGAVLTLAKKVGAINITAAFGDQTKLGTPGNYLLQGSLGVAPGLAAAGSIEVTGPGVTP